MYSILIKTNSTSDKYVYYLNNDGTIYTTDDLNILSLKINELLDRYTLKQIVPIKNCIITNNIEIIEVESE